MGILVFELSHLLLPRIYLIHITNISTTSTAVQGTLGQQKFRPFLCVSAMWVQHAAGLHAFTAKQQSSSRDENKMVTVPPCWLSCWNLSPIGILLVENSACTTPPKENLKKLWMWKKLHFQPCRNWSSSGFFAVPYLGGQAEWSMARCRARFFVHLPGEGCSDGQGRWWLVDPEPVHCLQSDGY